MRWTESQRRLRELAVTPVRGFKTNVILHKWSSGMSRVTTRLHRDSKKAKDGEVRCYTLDASTAWNAVVSLSDAAGTSGIGYTDRTLKALTALCARGPVCFLLEEFQCLKPKDQQRLVKTLEHASLKLKANVRWIMVASEVMRWVGYDGEEWVGRRKRTWPTLDTRIWDPIKSAGEWFYFTARGLDMAKSEESLETVIQARKAS